MPESEDDAAGIELEQTEQHAGADAAGEKRQVGLRQVAFDKPDVLRGACDVIRRADDAQDVAALQRRSTARAGSARCLGWSDSR